MVLPACAALLVLVYQFNFTQDDAYITFRYAANYAAGHGLVYNVGEHIEGYTNFLWTILMVLGRLSGADLVFFSKLLGTLCGLGTIVLYYFLGRHLTADLPAPWRSFIPGLACLFLGLTLSFAYWTVSGLETAAFTFMITAAFFTYLRRNYLVVPALVLATLLRPEGGLVWVFILAAELITRRSVTRYLVIIAGLYLVYLLPLAVFKYSYYGGLLPNPFYAKTSFQWEQLQNGLEYVAQYGLHYLGAGLFVLPAIWTFRRAERPLRILMFFVLVYSLYITVIGGDVLKVHRFFVPIMPVIIILVLIGFVRCLKNNVLIHAALVILLAAQIYMPLAHVQVFYRQERGMTRKMDTLMSNLLTADHSNFSLAVSTIGVVGYRLLGHEVIDLLGLTDSTIARHPEPPVEGLETTWRESHFNSSYVLGRQPDFILFSTGIKASAPAERALFLHSQFLNKYRTIGFSFGNQLHQIYKRYFPITPPVERDVSPAFERVYHQGIMLYANKEYKKSLDALNQALALSPQPIYPYIYAFMALSCDGLKDDNGRMSALFSMERLDTLVFEPSFDLYYYEWGRGNRGLAMQHRARVAKLTPWFLPTMDGYGRR